MEPKPNEEKKSEPAAEAKVEAPKSEAKKDPVKKLYNPPNFGDSAQNGIIKGLSGSNEQIAVLSYLNYVDLINVAKSSKYAYNLIMPRKTRMRILCWKPSKEDETKMQNLVMGYINKKAAEKA